MRCLSILLLAVLGLAAHATADEVLGLRDDALMAPLSGQDVVSVAGRQRSVLQYTSSPPYYCANSHIKNEFTASFAFLMVGTTSRPRVSSADGVKLFQGKITRRLARYNKTYRLNLTFVITQKSTGFATKKKQKWFYYDVKFIVGTCGKYKFPLITQLRGDIQPSSSFLRRARLLNYPVRR